VIAAAKVASFHERTLTDAQEGVRQAEQMWQRLLRSAFSLGGARGMSYEPLEALVAEQQLNQARLQYLNEVIAYHREQFRLYWAMGQPPAACLHAAAAQPEETPGLQPGPAAKDEIKK